MSWKKTEAKKLQTFYTIFKVKNVGTDQLCFDTLAKDEHFGIDLGVYYCQQGVSATQVVLARAIIFLEFSDFIS